MSLLRAVGIVGLSGWLAVGCAANETRRPETYVVRPRDTLYSIAWRYDIDYRELARWNDIGADFRIVVGQVLVLHPGTHAPAGPGPGPGPVAPAGGHAHPSAGCASWAWPTQHASVPHAVPSGGILLLGELGQPVRAACSGRVVYIGNGLRGYGNLLIIKHGETLLSAYAHNQDVLVHEGQEVLAGQDVAHMGLGPHQVPALYFEIRVNGKPVDPVPYLTTAK